MIHYVAILPIVDFEVWALKPAPKRTALLEKLRLRKATDGIDPLLPIVEVPPHNAPVELLFGLAYRWFDGMLLDFSQLHLEDAFRLEGPDFDVAVIPVQIPLEKARRFCSVRSTPRYNEFGTSPTYREMPAWFKDLVLTTPDPIRLFAKA